MPMKLHVKTPWMASIILWKNALVWLCWCLESLLLHVNMDSTAKLGKCLVLLLLLSGCVWSSTFLVEDNDITPAPARGLHSGNQDVVDRFNFCASNLVTMAWYGQHYICQDWLPKTKIPTAPLESIFSFCHPSTSPPHFLAYRRGTFFDFYPNLGRQPLVLQSSLKSGVGCGVHLHAVCRL